MQTENKSQKIAVTGATGRVGSHLVEILEQRGHDVVAIARSKGVDVVSGEGLDEALVGVEIIVDTATGPSPDQDEATAFFTASARNLQRAGAVAGAKRSLSSRLSGSTSSRAAITRRRWRRSGRCSKGRSRSGLFARPSFTSSSVRWSGGRSRMASPTCPRCEPSSWPPVSSLKHWRTRPRSRRSRTAGSPRSPAPRRSVSPMWRQRCSPAEVTRSRSARAVAACWRARRPRRGRLCGGRRAAQPGRQARRPQLRRVACGDLGDSEDARSEPSAASGDGAS